MNFVRNANTPHFSMEEIKEIYVHAKVKDDRSLQAAARELFPGRDPITYENLSISKGPGRAFKHHSDQYENPKCMIMAHPVIVGVMDDDTMYLF